MTSPVPSNRPPKMSASPKIPQPPISGRAILAGILCLCLGGIHLWRQAGHYQATQREQAALVAQACAGAVEASLNRPFTALDALAGFVRQNGGRLNGLAAFAAEILPPGADSLDLAPNGTISEVVPRAGRERMIGYNALSEPVTSVAVQVRKLGVAGPFALPGGGAGFVGRLPVFLKDAQSKELFWGLVSATVRLPQALPSASFERLAAQGYDYALLVPAPKPYPLVARGVVDPATAVVQRVQLSNAELILAIRPAQGWGQGSYSVSAVLIVLAISLLAAWAVQALGRNAWYKARLLESAKQAELEANHASTAEAGRHAAIAASEEEARSAKEATEALRAQLRVAENATRRAQERCLQLEEEMQMAKDTGAAMLSSARKMAESLQTGLREAQDAARLAQEERDKYRLELHQLRERASHEDVDAQLRRESLQSMLVETQVELQRNREQISLMEAELKSASTKTMQAEQAQMELMRQFELQKASAFRHRIEPDEAELAAPETSAVLTQHENGEFANPAAARAEEPAIEAESIPAEMPLAEDVLPPETVPVSAEELPVIEAASEVPDAALKPSADEPPIEAGVPGEPELAMPVVNESEPSQPVFEEVVAPVEPIPPSEKTVAIPAVENAVAELLEPPITPLAEASQPVSAREAHLPEIPSLADVPSEPVAVQSTETPPLSETTDLPATPAALELELGDNPKPEKPARRKKTEESAQLSLFETPAPVKAAPATRTKETGRDAKAKSAPLAAFDRATFKRSATELSMLLMESDPGAQECLEDYQTELRPAFTPDAYAEFAQRVRESDFHEALALLNKAARKHGVTLRHE